MGIGKTTKNNAEQIKGKEITDIALEHAFALVYDKYNDNLKYRGVTVANLTDEIGYIETAANGGNNNYQGSAPDQPKLDLVELFKELPHQNLGRMTVNIGVGAHKGAYVGNLINKTSRALLPTGSIELIGSRILATLTIGDNEGLASAGGLDTALMLAYFDKPLGSDNYVSNELVGKVVSKLSGIGRR